MALETALKFIERFEREASLRMQLYVSRPEDMTRLTEFARGKGFVISANDLADALEQYEEQFPTGSIEPLKTYLNGFKRLPSGEESAGEGAAVDSGEESTDGGASEEAADED